MPTTNLARPAAFGQSEASAPKRRKLAGEWNSDSDDGDDIFELVGDMDFDLPDPPAAHPPPRARLSSSPPVFSADATQLTQPLTSQPTQPLAYVHPDARPPSAYAQAPRQPAVQVPASSPVPARNEHGYSSPPSAQRRPNKRAGDGTVKASDFYPRNTHSGPNGGTAGFSFEGPQFVASSSDGEESDRGIRPAAFSSSSVRKSEQNYGAARPPQGGYSQFMPKMVPESPVNIKKHVSQFAYKPPGNAAASPVAMPGRRLDSLTRPGQSASALTGARIQRGPERAQPVHDLSLSNIPNQDWRSKIQRMKDVLPMKSVTELHQALASKKGSYDDAMELLTESDVVDLTQDSGSRAHVRTNRAQNAGKLKITDKWSSTQVPRQSLSSSPQPVETKPKRKLIRGSATTSLERSVSPLAPIVLDDDSDSAAEVDDDSEDERELERRVLKYINGCSIKELSDIACTTEEIAKLIIEQRPFKTLDDVRAVTSNIGNGKTKKGRGTRTKAIGDKVVDVCLETMRGYEAVDTLIAKVEGLGKPIAESIKAWGVDIFSGNDATPGELEIVDVNPDAVPSPLKDSGIGTPEADGSNAGSADDAEDVRANKRDKQGQILRTQPKNMADNVVLKDYQLVGVSWLNLLYEKNLSCILADEMGLGKTCQVVAFLAHLLQKGITGPHLVVVPSSTLENWLREFANFCPALKVEPYYGSQADRPMIRSSLQKNKGWHVLVTTYQLATGDKIDRGFLKSLQFNVCVYDEGHMLKNSNSNRYDALMKLPADFRLLLTGTPLQNNLQELASLLAFILPSVFNEKKEELASIFKYKAKTTDDEETNSALLSAQRIRRARAMMTPFVLRRKKQQVLKHLPGKTNRVQYCTLSKLQKDIYSENIKAAKEALAAREAGKKTGKTSSNVMMQLRKAAIHPLLFRTYYTDDKIKKMSKDIMKEPAYRDNDSKYILEDMEVMNDFELNRLCGNFPKTLGKHELKNEEWMDSGKIDAVKKVLMEMKENGDRVLLFSQFTQMLDILELVLTSLDLGYLRIDGSTPVEMRQDLIDQYHRETDIMVFLLSTKAGGFGINLACANKVVIFDSSFNPHDDAQASDRAHRVGQTREVEVIRLVTKNTIEEQILQLANTKLALDQSISADEKALEAKGEEMVAKMLLESGDAALEETA